MRFISTLLMIIAIAAIGYGVYTLMTDPGTDTTPPAEENGEDIENGDEDNDEEENGEDTDGGTADSVNVYVVDMEAGDVGCNDAIVPLERDIEPTQSVLGAALNELFTLESEAVSSAGYYNALENSDLEVESAAVEDGTATVRIVGEVSVGGVCDDPRFEEQIRQTVLQFETVDTAEIYVNDTALEDLFNAEGDQ